MKLTKCYSPLAKTQPLLLSLIFLSTSVFVPAGSVMAEGPDPVVIYQPDSNGTYRPVKGGNRYYPRQEPPPRFDWNMIENENKTEPEVEEEKTQPWSSTVTATPEEIKNSKDPRIFCQGFSKKEVTIDGQQQLRYVISDPKFMRCLPRRPSAPWTVTRDQWSNQDELNWQKFVKSIGESKCNTLDSCLASSANPYRDQIDIDGTHYSDCADFPMYMRAYFSFRNQLPFSVVLGFEPNPLSDEQNASIQKQREKAIQEGKLEKFEESVKDIRYSLNGNRPTSRLNIPQTNGAERDFFQITRKIEDVISSGTFRMHDTDSNVPADFYSPMITRDAIKPGTVLYKVTGHVALVYDVTDQGEVKFVDAHPDNSVTRGSFSRDYPRSNPFQGGGFKNWRPFKLVGVQKNRRGQDLPAQKNLNGEIASGRFIFAQDSEISDFSAEQYYGNKPAADWNWKNGQFIHKGVSLNMYDFIERRLSNKNYLANPVELFKRKMGSLCTDLQERKESVQKAIVDQIHTKDHPMSLPRNIYGADGEWESYSSPGRDLRIRKKALDVIDDAKSYLQRVAVKDPFYSYSKSLDELKADYIRVYNEINSTCRISYQNSANKEVTMDLTTALNRITKMSFDPYFCPELRWGAQFRTEMKTCTDSKNKIEWYEYTQFLRDQTVRDPSEVMGYTLDEAKKIQQMKMSDANSATSRFNILRRLKEL